MPADLFADMRRCPRWRELDAEQRKEYWASLALRHCRGLGARSCFKLAHTCGSAHAAVQRNAEWTDFGLRPEPGAALRSGAWRVTAREEWDAAVRLNPRILLWTDPLYPPLLRMLPDAPLVLYCDGDVSLLRSPCFAVVGARKAGDQARAVAAHMAQYLAAGGLAVVSGMAQGIDAAVHGSALRQIGRSIGVLGTGIDMAYPVSNRGLFELMRRDGLLLSEFAPGTRPQPGNFPIRNRIISGLSLGVLVVEAAERSGSLITARLALEQNREVYAVPGAALDSHNFGTHNLVRQGARPVFSAEDILRDLAPRLREYGVSRLRLQALGEAERSASAQEEAAAESEDCRQSAPAPAASAIVSVAAAPESCIRPAAPEDSAGNLPGISGDGLRILAALRRHGALQADDLAAATSLESAALNAALISLELLGQVRRLPGARYEALA